MEWNEFTKFCVESGLVATRRQIVPLQYIYKDNNKYMDKTSQGPYIRKLRYFEDIKLFIACEVDTSYAKVYSHDCKLLHVLDLIKVEERSTPDNTADNGNVSDGEAEDDVGDASWAAQKMPAAIEALDAEYIHSKKILIILCNNMKAYIIDVNTTKNPVLEDAKNVKVARKVTSIFVHLFKLSNHYTNT